MPEKITPEGAKLCGSMGWDGTQWRKLALLFGFTDRWAERVVDENADAGTNWLQTAVVPLGYVYVAQAASSANLTHAPTLIRISAFDGTYGYDFINKSDPAAAERVCWSGAAALKAGDSFLAEISGCMAGDDIELCVWGYKMAVT